MTDLKAEGRAETMGYIGREVGHPRNSNPYTELSAQTLLEREILRDLETAWWRGWDQADTVIQARAR